MEKKNKNTHSVQWRKNNHGATRTGVRKKAGTEYLP